MSAKKVVEEDYIQFLLAAPGRATCTEAERTLKTQENDAAHDAYNRLLNSQPPNTEALWQEASKLLQRSEGVLVLDDSTLDKPYARNTELVSFHWSGKHHRVVRGINLQTLLWTDGIQLIPCDFRVYEGTADGATKNEAFREMLQIAKERNLSPNYVLFDSWYGSLDNLKFLRSLGWSWLTMLKKNRLVNPDETGNRAIETVEIPPSGKRVHLKGYGFIRVFRVKRGDEWQYWATNELSMLSQVREALQSMGWGIEIFHRGLKQNCAVERSQVRTARAIKAHLSFAIRAFLRLEVMSNKLKTTYDELKANLFRQVVRNSVYSRFFSLRYSTA